MSRFIFILRLVLGAVFLYAGLIKASASAQFAVTLLPFTIVPVSLAPLIVIALPWVEIAAGTGVLVNQTKQIGAALIFVLCFLFMGIIIWALANGIIVSCGCFGWDETPSAFKMQLAVIRDVLLALAAGAVFVHAHRVAGK